MQKLFYKLTLIVIAIVTITSCNKDLGGNPTLEFLTGSAYLSKNDSIAIGDTVLIGLKCKWNGKDPLEKINIRLNDIHSNTIKIESPDSEGVTFNFKFGKTAAEKDSLAFELVDIVSQTASISLVLYKKTTKSNFKILKKPF